jgi:hypothetical protein
MTHEIPQKVCRIITIIIIIVIIIIILLLLGSYVKYTIFKIGIKNFPHILDPWFLLTKENIYEKNTISFAWRQVVSNGFMGYAAII